MSQLSANRKFSSSFPIVQLSAIQGEYIGNHLWQYNSDGRLTFDQVMSRADSFTLSEMEVPNLGVSEKDHWLYIQLENDALVEDPILELSYPVIDEVDLFIFDQNGDLSYKVNTGECVDFDQRDYLIKDFVFRLEFDEGNVAGILMRLRSGEQIMAPMKVRSYEKSLEDYLIQDVLFGVYFGIVIVMFFYNFFIFLSTRDRAYLFYVIYILAVGMTQAVLQGYAFQYFWPGLPSVALRATYFSGVFSGITVLIFAREFLHIRQQNKLLDNILLAFIFLDLIALIFAFSGHFNLSYNLINLVAGVGSLMLMGIALYYTLKGQREARFFLAAWSIFLVSIIIYVLKDLGVFYYNQVTDSVLMAGSAVEVVLLSLALADRINILKRESELARQREIEALQKNQDLIQKQNIELEQRVDERTKELKEANLQLESAMKDLKQAQVQLVNAEKMASLGQLTAGIAHEINNPINFVAASVNPLRNDLNDVKQMIEKYETSLESLNEEVKNELNNFKQRIDLEFTMQEIDDLLNGVEEGAKRTAEIVQGLKNFSRLDESDSKFADIHEGLDSTLIILRNAIKDNIEVIKDFDDSIGQIECYPGKLNQVFSNILVNAVQAIESEKDRSEPGRITITTRDQGDHIVVTLSDNGPGIPDHIKDKIFEPFFTTKEVGEGTGLGLSIVYSIIEQHKGELKLESKMGEGTAFIITLPKALN